MRMMRNQARLSEPDCGEMRRAARVVATDMKLLVEGARSTAEWGRTRWPAGTDELKQQKQQRQGEESQRTLMHRASKGVRRPSRSPVCERLRTLLPSFVWSPGAAPSPCARPRAGRRCWSRTAARLAATRWRAWSGQRRRRWQPTTVRHEPSAAATSGRKKKQSRNKTCSNK